MAIKGQGSQTVIDLTDGFSVFLSQDNANWNGIETKLGTAQSVEITVSAYQGTTAASFTIGTCTRTDTTNCTATVSGSKVTVNVGANATTGGTVTIPVNISSNGSTITINKSFSYGISLKGTPGTPGTNGTNGTNGADGQDGQDGEDGAPAIAVVVTGNTVIRNNSGSTTLYASVYVGGVQATVNSSTGVVTLSGSTIGTIKWYDGPSDQTGTAGGSYTVSASTVANSLEIIAKLEG